MIPEPIVISELRLGGDIENEHQTWANFQSWKPWPHAAKPRQNL